MASTYLFQTLIEELSALADKINSSKTALVALSDAEHPLSQAFGPYFKRGIYPGTPAGATRTVIKLLAGSGVPSNSDGANGDVYFRSNTGITQLANTVYQKRAGVWEGLTIPTSVVPLKIRSSANFVGAEAQVIGITLPANYLQVGSTYRFQAGGTYAKSEPPISSGQVELRLRIGAASLTGTQVAIWRQLIKSTVGAIIHFSIEGMLTVTAIGAAGSCVGWVGGHLFAPDPLLDNVEIPASVSVNTTLERVMELTIESVSGAQQQFTVATIERISPAAPPALI